MLRWILLPIVRGKPGATTGYLQVIQLRLAHLKKEAGIKIASISQKGLPKFANLAETACKAYWSILIMK